MIHHCQWNFNSFLICLIRFGRSRSYTDIEAKEVGCCIGNTTDVIPASLSYTVWISHICCQRRESEDKTELHRLICVVEESFFLVVSSTQSRRWGVSSLCWQLPALRWRCPVSRKSLSMQWRHAHYLVWSGYFSTREHTGCYCWLLNNQTVLLYTSSYRDIIIVLFF